MTPRAPQFFAPEPIDDLTGCSILLTGATGGLGSALASRLSRSGADLILATRNRDMTDKLAASLPGPSSWLPLDLGDLDSVANAAAQVQRPLDYLVHCAGAVPSWKPRGFAAGDDPTMTVNFLGPFLLTGILLHRIRDRVVTVGSIRHWASRLDAGRVPPRISLVNPQRSYADSKLAVTAWAFELDRRLRSERPDVRSVVTHPGWVRTRLTNAAFPSVFHPLVNLLASRLSQPVDVGVTPIASALSADLTPGLWTGPGGCGKFTIGPTSLRSVDQSLANALWAWAERRTGFIYPISPAQPFRSPGSG